VPHAYPEKLDPAALTALPRDFVGYGRYTPDPKWPNGNKVVVNLVVNYEEGAEYSLLDGDDTNDAWGEYSYEIGPTVRDLSTETHMEFGSRVGGWRLARLLDDYKIDATIDVCAHAVERNPEYAAWLRESKYDVMGHGWRWTEDSRLPRAEEQKLMRRAIASIFIDDARRAKVFRRTAGRFAAGEVTADSADALASRDAVMAALGTLPPQVRACVLLRYYDDLSIAQISHSLKIAEGSVKRYLHDGAVTLRGILAADHDDASELISVHAITHRGRN